jgi:hypothetical protein
VTASSTASSAAPRTITHRYAWSGEERAILAVFVLGPTVTTLALARGAGGVDTVLAVVLHVVGLGAAAGLFALGSRRKNRSRISAVLTGTRLEVHGGRVQRSRGDIAGTRTVETIRLGPETVLVLTNDHNAQLRVPARIAIDPALAPVLRRHLNRDGVNLSPLARTLVQGL